MITRYIPFQKPSNVNYGDVGIEEIHYVHVTGLYASHSFSLKRS